MPRSFSAAAISRRELFPSALIAWMPGRTSEHPQLSALLIRHRLRQQAIIVLDVVHPPIQAPSLHLCGVEWPQKINRWPLRAAGFQPSLEVLALYDERHSIMTGLLYEQFV